MLMVRTDDETIQNTASYGVFLQRFSRVLYAWNGCGPADPTDWFLRVAAPSESEALIETRRRLREEPRVSHKTVEGAYVIRVD